MRSRIRFYDRRGIPLEEIDATTKREWLLDNVGECTFTMSRWDEKLIRYVVEFGNLILVTNPYTKPWVGVLDTPRTWTKQGPKISAYSAEMLFSFYAEQNINLAQNTIQLPVKLTGTAGSIFTKIISRANELEDSLIRAGSIYAGGTQREETLSTDYLTSVRGLASRSGNNWDVMAEEQSNNTLLLRGNWHERKGTTLEIALEEGVNIQMQDELMTEQGIILNSVLGVGAGSTEATRLGSVQKDAVSVLRYGTRRGSSTYSSVSQLATLIDNTKSAVKASAYPRLTTRVHCVDSGLFKEMNEGDIVPFIAHNAGFSSDETLGTNAMTRILGLGADDDTGALEVLLDEFAGDD